MRHRRRVVHPHKDTMAPQERWGKKTPKAPGSWCESVRGWRSKLLSQSVPCTHTHTHTPGPSGWCLWFSLFWKRTVPIDTSLREKRPQPSTRSTERRALSVTEFRYRLIVPWASDAPSQKRCVSEGMLCRGIYGGWCHPPANQNGVMRLMFLRTEDTERKKRTCCIGTLVEPDWLPLF